MSTSVYLHYQSTLRRVCCFLPMPLVKCPGWNREYESGRSLTSHQRGSTDRLKATVGVQLRKRRINTKAKQKAKVPRHADMDS